MALTTLLLFVGGALQNGMVAAGIRYLTVAGSPLGIVATTFVVQSLWWVNIQAVKRTDAWEDWIAWTLGNVVGALVGYGLTGGRNRR